MDKIKPYAFWIICGVFLIAEIVVMSMITPTHPDPAKDGTTVEVAVQQANRRFSELGQKAVKHSRCYATTINLCLIRRPLVLRTRIAFANSCQTI